MPLGTPPWASTRTSSFTGLLLRFGVDARYGRFDGPLDTTGVIQPLRPPEFPLRLQGPALVDAVFRRRVLAPVRQSGQGAGDGGVVALCEPSALDIVRVIPIRTSLGSHIG